MCWIIKLHSILEVFNLEQTPIFYMVLNRKTHTALKKISSSKSSKHLQKEALKYQMKDDYEEKKFQNYKQHYGLTMIFNSATTVRHESDITQEKHAI